MSRILGIDYGTRRVGLALSDPFATFASPLAVVDVRGPRQVIREIRRHCREQDVVRLVIGLPLSMDGTEGPAAKAAREFGEDVGRTLGLPVTWWDERLSTVTARQALIEGGARRERRKGLVDKIAAQVMLQHYLDAHPGEAGLPPA
jgi:putative Holliday junction resolvase